LGKYDYRTKKKVQEINMPNEYKYEKYSDKQLKKMLKTTDKTKSQRSFNKFYDIQDELNFRSRMKKKSKEEINELYNEIMREREAELLGPEFRPNQLRPKPTRKFRR
tara:strand:+ start:801 stop:1121 length:321 start_codon:yes stop_codon:yes gene_type:complete